MHPGPELPFDAFADTDEMGCGSLMIALRKAILPLPPGSVLKVRALDPGAIEDIPAWCRLTGHELLSQPPPGDPWGLYFIRKSSAEN